MCLNPSPVGERKPYRITITFTYVAADLAEAETLCDEITHLAETGGDALLEHAHVEEMPVTDVVPGSPLERRLA